MKKLQIKTMKSLILVILVLHIVFFSPNQSSSQPINDQINDSSSNSPVKIIGSSAETELTQSVSNDQSIQSSSYRGSLDPVQSLGLDEIITMPKLDTVGTVLLLHADPGYVDYIASFLFSYGINTAQFPIMSLTPSLADLTPYQIVVVWTNVLPLDPFTTGNILADYVDAGGSVVMTTYSHSPAPSGIDGRFFNEKYSAFIKTGITNSFGRIYDGLSTHPMFDGINSIESGSTSEQVVLDPGATLVASYTDTVPLAAIKGKVVNINVWFGPSGIGDFQLMLANAINYLDKDVLLLYADTSPSPTTITDLLTPYGHTVDQMNVSTAIPSLSQIKLYPVIISWTNSIPVADNVAWGDLMADYIDSGGTLIMMPFTYFRDPWSLAGRFLNEKYSPISYGSTSNLTANYAGSSEHPIFEGVNDYTTTMAVLPTLRTGAKVIAFYEDKTIFSAIKGSVLVINSYIPSNAGGDIGLLLSHTIEFFLSGYHLDVEAPIVSSPVDVIMEYGTTGQQIAWTLNDANPWIYDLKLDGVSLEGGPWTDGLVVWTGLDGFGLGDYSFEISVFDHAGNLTSDVVLVSVVDTTLPSIVGPDDFEGYQYETAINITWKLGDLLPNNYSVTHNGTLIKSGVWISGDEIVLDLTMSILGLHIFEVTASDSSGNVAVDSVSVIVVSSGIPQISGPFDIYFLEGDSGRKITWYFSDNDPTIYVLERDSVVLDTASYVGLPFIEIQLSNYTNGNYNFTLSLYDESGNIESDTVLVHILIRNPAGSGSPSPSGGSPPRLFDNPVVIAVTAGFIILGGGILFLRRRVA